MHRQLVWFIFVLSACVWAAAGQTVAPSEASELSNMRHLGYWRMSREEVRAALDASLSKFPTSEPLLSLAANIAQNAIDRPSAISFMERLVAVRPSNAEYHGRLAYAYLLAEHDTDALREGRAALRLDPQSEYGNYALGLLLLYVAEDQQASDVFAKVRGERLDAALLHRAECEIRLGNIIRALEIMQPMSARSQDESVSNTFIRIFALLHRYEDAEPFLLKLAAAKTPPQVFHKVRLGDIYDRMGQFDKAIAAFNEAIALKPDDDSYKKYLADARRHQAEAPRVEVLIDEVNADPNNIQKLLSLGQALERFRRYEEAKKVFVRIYALDPPDPQVYARIGSLLVALGRQDEAVEAYKKGAAKGGSADIYFNLASIYDLQGRFTEAADLYARGIQLKPDSGRYLASYGKLLDKLRKRAEALAMYKRYLAAFPKDLDAIHAAAILSEKLGDHAAALGYLNTLKAVQPVYARWLERFLALKLYG